MTTEAPLSPEDLLRNELTALLNRHSRENDSDTPDFILAQVMMDALVAFEQAVRHRAHWYGEAQAPGSREQRLDAAAGYTPEQLAEAGIV